MHFPSSTAPATSPPRIVLPQSTFALEVAPDDNAPPAASIARSTQQESNFIRGSHPTGRLRSARRCCPTKTALWTIAGIALVGTPVAICAAVFIPRTDHHAPAPSAARSGAGAYGGLLNAYTAYPPPLATKTPTSTPSRTSVPSTKSSPATTSSNAKAVPASSSLTSTKSSPASSSASTGFARSSPASSSSSSSSSSTSKGRKLIETPAGHHPENQLRMRVRAVR